MPQMKVVHLWKSDSGFRGGGGAIAMHRLHYGLRKADIDSKILCKIKTLQSPHIQVFQRLEDENLCYSDGSTESGDR